MPVGLDDAAAAAGLVSLAITLLDGCLKAFIFLKNMQQYSDDVEFFLTQLALEHNRLWQWGQRSGLLEEPPEATVINATSDLVKRTLGQLEHLLTDAKTLKEEYGIDTTLPASGDREVLATNREVSSRSFPRFHRSKPKLYVETATSLQASSKFIDRVKFQAVDKARFEKLIARISYLNSSLEQLLPPRDRKENYRDLNASLRTNVVEIRLPATLAVVDQVLRISHVNAPDTIDVTIAAAARFKQNRLSLGLLEIEPRGSSRVEPVLEGTNDAFTNTDRQQTLPPRIKEPRHKMMLDWGCLERSLDRKASGTPREAALYEQKSVVVEWKVVDRAFEAKLKLRITNVATLLHEIIDPSFHTLRCIGYLKEPSSGRYGYVFETPPPQILPHDGIDGSNQPSWNTLSEILTDSQARPSIDCRLKIAIALTETVLQLHTSGWLHKGIRSDNVLCFATGRGTHVLDEENLDVYLGGYEYARMDKPLETTEKPPAQPALELYRHPSSLGTEPFSKRFDLYGLGCVLLELGFWCPLESVLVHWLRNEKSIKSGTSPRLHGETLQIQGQAEFFALKQQLGRFLQEEVPGSIKAYLEFYVGKTFASAVWMCLHAKKENAAGPQAEAELDYSLATQECVLNSLRSCLPL